MKSSKGNDFNDNIGVSLFTTLFNVKSLQMVFHFIERKHLTFYLYEGYFIAVLNFYVLDINL